LRREEQLSAGGGEHRVGGDRRAIDGEASTGQRFKSGAQRWIADEIMRPGEPAKQNEGLAADNRQVVEARAKSLRTSVAFIAAQESPRPPPLASPSL